MKNSYEEKKIQKFISLTECTPKLARKYLQRNQWYIDYALNDFYDSELGGFVDTAPKDIKYPQELIDLFNKYSPDGNEIDVEGIMAFIDDLGLKLEDIVTICLAKLLGWNKLTDLITKDQFLSNWYMQGCSHISEMKTVMQDLKNKLATDPKYLTDVYNFTFDLIIDDDAKMLDLKTAIEYWKLYFCQDLERKVVLEIDPKLLADWVIFLETENRNDITKDCWKMLLEFFRKYPTLDAIAEDYDENDPWPYIFDEFYEYLQEIKGI
ncbi:similar to Saccharomyces cerevisiae YLR128W DCN1 Scaffold-type E3 ligase required for cullin neddylation and ubiquitin ligase activation [Maudiozyma saulgeensis]|uniref:Defective in cullin neddylation protein n=1 Tax=Maudiozyma saulgeensis TaxID=1789683 RepID=A0A1X7R5D5_9SACH|nr:similar to Saccharomyces cerevisiae YLR128W DCN1 Scaffold-type E3 ligase required for cullin neddylation and ubiquitin ligase activation [Kazachstania saulgeensis]